MQRILRDNTARVISPIKPKDTMALLDEEVVATQAVLPKYNAFIAHEVHFSPLTPASALPMELADPG
jgi:hypothetical protein